MAKKSVNFPDAESAEICLMVNKKNMDILLYMFFIPTVAFNIWIGMFADVSDIVSLAVLAAIFPVMLFASNKFTVYSNHAHGAIDYLKKNQ